LAQKPSLCVVNFNGAAFLESTLRAALDQEGSLTEILLVDGGSTDESLQLVRSQFPSVRVIELEENRGPAVSRNVALREARSDLVLLVDSDVSLAPGCSDRLVEALREHPNAAVAMPRVLYARDQDRIQYDGADHHFIGLMSLHNRDVPLSESASDVRPIGSVVTACVLVDRSRVSHPEPFDEAFFIYLEDHDFAVRIRANGHEILSVPSAACYHAEGTPGLSIRAIGEYSSMRVFCLIRNRWQFILKNYSLRSLLLLSPVFFVYEGAQFAVVVKKGWLLEWMRAVMSIVRHLPSILRKRRQIQKSRERPDRGLFTDGPIPFRDELVTGALERGSKRALEAMTSLYWQKVARLV
jgi:GT2 family glycosyltransferase